MGKLLNKMKKIKSESKKSSIIVYLILRFLVIVCMILQFIRGDLNNAILCLLSLFLFVLPAFIEKKFKIEMPDLLEIIIMLFIFSAEILGEINNFYGIFPHWDTMLHTINGFIAAGFGFSLCGLLNDNIKDITLSPLFLAIVSFSFLMTIGVLWEFYEFCSDWYLFSTDMQKDRIITDYNSVYLNDEKNNKVIKIDNIDKTIIYQENGDEVIVDNGYLDIGLIDTMKDLFVNFIGALGFSVVGYYHVKHKGKYRFLDNFILTRRREVGD